MGHASFKGQVGSDMVWDVALGDINAYVGQIVPPGNMQFFAVDVDNTTITFSAGQPHDSVRVRLVGDYVINYEAEYTGICTAEDNGVEVPVTVRLVDGSEYVRFLRTDGVGWHQSTNNTRLYLPGLQIPVRAA